MVPVAAVEDPQLSQIHGDWGRLVAQQVTRATPNEKVLTWSSLLDVEGDALEIHYRHILETLAKERRMLSVIFRSRREGRRRGTVLYARPLIQAIVDVMRPAPGQTIHDPACGTGGFMLIAHDYVSQHHELDRNQKKQLKLKALSGVELVDSVARLCVINLYLHGVGGEFTRSNGKPVLRLPRNLEKRMFPRGSTGLAVSRFAKNRSTKPTQGKSHRGHHYEDRRMAYAESIRTLCNRAPLGYE